jgi:two-component system heavy metal sensor histidine kinase CusS
MKTRLRFRSRLIAAVVGVTVLTLGGAFFAVLRLMNSENQRQVDVALVAEAHEEARAAAALGGDRLQPADESRPHDHHIHAVIFDAAGRALESSEAFRGRLPPPEALSHPSDECFDLWLHREHLRVVLTSIPGHPGNRLLMAAPRFDEDRDAAFLRRAMLIIFAVAVFWAALVATWVVRRLTRGHAAVTSVARQVADGNLSARVRPDLSDPEMAQLGRDVNQMIERLGSLLRAQEEFITHGAHELRSPLTTLSGELALALRRGRDIEGYKEAIESALESAQRLKGLAETLLTMARIGGAAEEPPEKVGLQGVLERAARAVAGGAALQHVGVEIHGGPVAVSGRSQDLERLFCNLLENAIRHSPTGGRVRVRVVDEGERVSVHVADEGRGVPEEDRDRIFQPFYRGRSSYGTSGYGLGLAIAAKVARAHGGRLSLAPSRVGAEFVVELHRS